MLHVVGVEKIIIAEKYGRRKMKENSDETYNIWMYSASVRSAESARIR